MNKFDKALKRSKESWFSRVARLLDRATVEETLWDELEELLISADVGVATTTKLLERLKARMGRESRRRLTGPFAVERGDDGDAHGE